MLIRFHLKYGVHLLSCCGREAHERGCALLCHFIDLDVFMALNIVRGAYRY